MHDGMDPEDRLLIYSHFNVSWYDLKVFISQKLLVIILKGHLRGRRQNQWSSKLY